MQPPAIPPSSIDSLAELANAIAGYTLGELAQFASIEIPTNFQRHKGWSGQLIELWLGASAGSKPIQDFPELGIELKTIPIDALGRPLETTYVCYAPLLLKPGECWETSNVRNKLNLVLWVPIEGERSIPIHDRRVGTPFLWQPNEQESAQLAQDWNELSELIMSGKVESITSRHGNVLQLRPKAANGSVLTDAIGEEGQRIQTRPRGFYLKKAFTQNILLSAFT
ncbi:DNA mismatch repair endonuclease MutH [Alteromonas sp. 5E99-2]|uniref:DNA mismatch repair endonuclease MutH n=1 Tax=Alteromonas sp. 5E99-2 TaxID=2817683 RepID=UPI001A987C6A|nr:DNA mismatch repair endonuclease MutH [Alteromonas sp. 5E99-2]MBO1256627.1 DNA mismatch repair endonuclease MutH [Alteromonas sp. 5E99-2]